MEYSLQGNENYGIIYVDIVQIQERKRVDIVWFITTITKIKPI